MKAETGSAVRSEIVVDRVRIEVIEFRPTHPDALTIVMLHEGLGSVSAWRHFPERVAKATECRVVAYSRQGYGKSDKLTAVWTPAFMHHEGEAVLPSLLERIDAPVPVLLGHSDGGSISLLHAAARPKAVKGLILQAPHVFVEDLTVRSIQALHDAYGTSDLREKMARHHRHPEELFRAWTGIWLDPAFRRWNIEDRLKNIRCPALVIQGEDDEYGTREQVESIKRHVRGTQTLMLPNCGHAPHRDQPDAVLASITDFVGKLK
jgi:pimeloyl-ACP methyl ester carboxylesterase